MPHTVEAVYHDGVIELKEIPSGIKRARVLVTFPDEEEENKIRFIDWNKVKKNKSTVDKWIGFLEGADIGDWKAARRKYLEDKHN